MYSRSCNLCKFWELTDNILETVQDSDTVTMEDYSYVVYRMAPKPMTMSDPEGHFCGLKLF